MAWRYRNYNEESREETEVEKLFPEKSLMINPFKIYFNLVDGSYKGLRSGIEAIENKCAKLGDKWRGNGKYALVSLPAGIAASNIADSHRWFRSSGWSGFSYLVGGVSGGVAGGLKAISLGMPQAVSGALGFAAQAPVTGLGSFFSAMATSTGSMVAHAGSFLAGAAIGVPTGFLGTVAAMFVATAAAAVAFSALKSARNLPVAIQRWNYTRKKNKALTGQQLKKAGPAVAPTNVPATGSSPSFNAMATPPVPGSLPAAQPAATTVLAKPDRNAP